MGGRRRFIGASALLVIGCGGGGSPAVPDADRPGPRDGGTAFDAGAEAAADAPVWPAPRMAATLPLEVLGAPGAGVEITIVLDAADVRRASGAGAELALVVQNVVAPESATVSVNDGPALDLGDPDGSLLRRYDGRVASGTIVINPALLRAGPNRLVFRYTRQVVQLAAVSGFRVGSYGFRIAPNAEPT